MTITQTVTLDEERLNILLRKYGDNKTRIDLASVEHGIDVVEAKLDYLRVNGKGAKDKLKIKSYTEILKYLDGLSSKKYSSEEGFIEKLRFRGRADGIAGIPIVNLKVDELDTLGMRMEYLDYVVNDRNTALVRLNYSELMRGLALELAREDLGFSMEESEAMLENTSIVIPNNVSVLEQFIGGEDLEKTVPGLRIGESSYFDAVKKKAFSYYLDPVSDIYSYAGMLNSTTKKTMALIASNLLEDIDGLRVKGVKLLAVYQNELVFEVDGNLEDVLSILGGHVNAQIMGRKFKYHPAVQIIEREN